MMRKPIGFFVGALASNGTPDIVLVGVRKS